MYVPDEGLYVEAMRARPTLFDEVRREQVLLAGPATLLALLGVTAQLLGEFRAVSEAKEIVAEARELHGRLATFTKHLVDVGRRLDGAVKGYNQAVGSWDSRLMPKARRLAERTLDEPIAPPAAIETSVRAIAIPEEGPPLTATG